MQILLVDESTDWTTISLPPTLSERDSEHGTDHRANVGAYSGAYSGAQRPSNRGADTDVDTIADDAANWHAHDTSESGSKWNADCGAKRETDSGPVESNTGGSGGE